MAAQQCSRCDKVADCIDSGMSALEDVADVLGVPTPSLHRHLVQHDRDDLLRELTYGGEPILPPPADPAKTGGVETSPPATDQGVEQPAAEETVCNCGAFTQCSDTNVAWPIVDLLPSGEGEQHHTPARCNVKFPWKDQERVLREEQTQEWLTGLHNSHPSDKVRVLAGDLANALDDWRTEQVDRIRLEQLVVQRDQLNDEIEQLSRKLGDTVQEDQQPKVPAARQVTTPTSTIRTWCIANGIDVPARGVLPRDAMDAWRAAHPEAS